MIEIKFERS